MSKVARFKSIIFLLAVLMVPGISFAIDFDQLVANPRKYSGKRVAVIGVAAVDGPHFVLYQPPRADTKAGFAREILISPRVAGPRYLHLNNHWVKVVGIAYARQRPTDYYGCIIDLERVEMLGTPPVNEPEILALFANESSFPVQIKLYDRRGGLAEEFDLGIHGIDKSKVEELEDGTVKVFDHSEKLLSAAGIPQHRTPNNFDTRLGTFYFQIVDGKVSLVTPENAILLKNRWHEIQKQTERQR